MYKASIITLSDRASMGIYEDESGPILINKLKENNYEIINYHLINDDPIKLKQLILEEIKQTNLLITTGGTGLTTSDITVDVVEELIDYEVRGMSVALHQFNLSKSPGAMFSRGLCGVKDKTLIMTLPGSKKAVNEIIDYFVKYLEHGLDHLNDVSRH